LTEAARCRPDHLCTSREIEGKSLSVQGEIGREQIRKVTKSLALVTVVSVIR